MLNKNYLAEVLEEIPIGVVQQHLSLMYMGQGESTYELFSSYQNMEPVYSSPMHCTEMLVGMMTNLCLPVG